MDLFRNFTRPNYGGRGTGGSQVYQGPFDLTKPLQSSAYDPMTGTWSGGNQAYQGSFDLNAPLQQFQVPTMPSPPSMPVIQPPGQVTSPIVPPAIGAPQQPTSNQPRPAQVNPIPMPDQLGAAANQSMLAQGSLLGGNWSQLFGG